MQFQHSKLKGKIKEEGFTQEDIAKRINISPSTFSIKINGVAYFNQDEIQQIASILNLSD